MSGYQKAKIVTTTSIKTTTDPQTKKTTGRANTNVTQVGPCGPCPSGLRPPTQIMRARPTGGACKPTCGGAGGGGQSRAEQQGRPMPPSRQLFPQRPPGLPAPSYIPATITRQLPPRPPSGLPQRSGPTTVPCAARAAAQGQPQQRPSQSRLPQSAGFASSTPIPSRSGIPRLGTRPQPSGIRPPAVRRPQPPPTLDQKLGEQLCQQSILNPGKKVTVKNQKKATICPERIDTPAGREQVLQKAVLEQRLERDEVGEKMVKSLKVSDLNKQKGKVNMMEVNIQQLDPNYARIDGGKDVIGVTSTVSVTPSYKTYSRECVRVSTEPTEPEIEMSLEEVAQMVAEEKEDVENTLKMVPPELVLIPGRYEMKRRLHSLRIHSESMALLEQSIINPQPTADEAQAEPAPEIMATMMHTVETGVSPQSAPDEVFNTLFQENANEHFIKLSSVSPGPMQDVVVPGEMPKDIHKEALSGEMGSLAEKLANGSPPEQDLFDKMVEEMHKTPEKGKNNPRSFQPISDENSPWANAELERLVNLVGAEPVEVLDPFNTEELDIDDLIKEMGNGVDLFLDANPVQYMSRVQLRGSQLPSYFPGN
ncbi:unnamed protein product [Acanthoscelides obtectus]|uniref:Uncharacterized protein n=1 Tax=Acanthoscelides obtectus TaxID=200917 RepID=A0A9P0Q497_ACAOB|nr:unnamed protein product [Acanthoscelides obtectus]CAK1672227.1 hypothetical protein AOBTE_LOCUS28727 [Acanthoscelides obtectus]